jgi:hypothetical protein
VSSARGPVVALLLALAIAGAGAARAAADDPAAGGPVAADSASAGGDAVPAAPGPARRADGLEALVPELADGAYRLEPGPRPYGRRISFSPTVGKYGSETLFALHLAYNPNPWLGYEANLGHTPGQAVHAVLHGLNAVVRHPLPGRLQPYVSAGYGMILVFPGPSLNADPVTKNTLNVGGGLEFFIRGDLALRAEMRRSNVFGRQRDREGVVTFDYLEQSLGLAFYRAVRP